jgi:hypothetical protein
MPDKTKSLIEKWIPILKVGTFFDSSGQKHVFTEEKLDLIAQKYAQSEHEAPAVIGHPETNSPAWGWVDKFKRIGEILFFKLSQAAPDFEQWVRDGRYKKRSISLYPDLTPRHVGWLGAQPPAVPGLADAFTSPPGDSLITFDFGEKHFTVKNILSNLRDWLIEKEGIETADRIVSQFDLQFLGQPEPELDQIAPAFNQQKIDNSNMEKTKMHKTLGEKIKAAFTKSVDNIPSEDFEEIMLPGPNSSPASFSQADLDAAKAAGEKEAKEKADAEFAQKNKDILTANLKKEIADFCEAQAEEGKIIPAWTKAGLREFMLSLVEDDTQIEFAEGEEKISRLVWFKNFMSELPKVVDFKEVAERGDTLPDDAGGKLTAFAEQLQKDEGISFYEAFDKVQRQHPALTQEYINTLE